MAGEEDTELRDLVAQTLESKGVLGKIRAQLRAHVFLALEEQENEQKRPSSVNEELFSFSNTREGRLVMGLVREFLEFYELSATLAVFEPEADVADKYNGRASLARDLDIVDDDEPAKPLLDEVIKRLSKPSILRSTVGMFTSNDLSSRQIAEAREKFAKYDTDHNGLIDKEELQLLFLDLLPQFSANMLDCYIGDEFAGVDRDLNGKIDVDEFLSMYRKLFVSCQSVVCHDGIGLQPRITTGIGAEAPRADSGKNELTEIMNRVGDGQSYASTFTTKPTKQTKATTTGLSTLTDVQNNLADYMAPSHLQRDLPAGEGHGEDDANSVGSAHSLLSHSSQRSNPRGSGVGKEDGIDDVLTATQRGLQGLDIDNYGLDDDDDDDEHGMGDGGNDEDLFAKPANQGGSGGKRLTGARGLSLSTVPGLADETTKDLLRERDILARANDQLGIRKDPAAKEPLSRNALPPLSGTGNQMSTLSGAPALGRFTGSSFRSMGVMGAEIGQSTDEDVKRLADINSQLSKLGISLSGDNGLDQQGDADAQNYDDDFNSLASRQSGSVSITESLDDIISDDGNMLDQKLDDLLTSDHTISQGSIGDCDYMESITSN